MTEPTCGWPAKALETLKPGISKWTLKGIVADVSQLDWFDESESKPTQAEWDAEIKRLKDLDVAEEYKRKRQYAYPGIGDQLDDLYKKGGFSKDMAAKIKKVKDDNPKP